MRFFRTTSQFLLYRRYLNPPGGSSAQTRLPHYKSSDVSIWICTVHQPRTVDHTQQLPTHDTVTTSLSHYPVFKSSNFHVSPTHCHLTSNSTPHFLNHPSATICRKSSKSARIVPQSQSSFQYKKPPLSASPPHLIWMISRLILLDVHPAHTMGGCAQNLPTHRYQVTTRWLKRTQAVQAPPPAFVTDPDASLVQMDKVSYQCCVVVIQMIAGLHQGFSHDAHNAPWVRSIGHTRVKTTQLSRQNMSDI